MVGSMCYPDTTSKNPYAIWIFRLSGADRFVDKAPLITYTPATRRRISRRFVISAPEPLAFAPRALNGNQRDEDYFAEARRGREEVGCDRRERPRCGPACFGCGNAPAR